MSSISPQIMTNNPAGTEDRAGRAFDYRTLSAALRTIGALVLVASLSVMLFRSWTDGSDLTRFYTLLSYCGVLATIGVVLGSVVHENKGARTFLALALGAVSVSVAVLGALSYSQFSHAAVAVPSFAAWVAPDTRSLMLALAMAAAVLSPIAYFGFAVFARRSAKRLTLLYLFSNAMLLLPSRLPAVIGTLALLLVVASLHQLATARRHDSALATREGRLVIATQFLPIAILLGRNFCLYAIDESLLTLSAVIVYVILRECPQEWQHRSGFTAQLLRLARVTAAFAAALGAAATAVAAGAPQAAAVPAFTLVLTALLADIGLSAPSGDARYTRAAGVTLAVGFMINLLVWPSMSGALIAIATGTAVAIYGFSVEQKSVFLAGAATLLAGLVHQLHDAFRFVDFASWSGLALVGIGAIIVASVLERHGLVLRSRIMTWRERFSAWEY